MIFGGIKDVYPPMGGSQVSVLAKKVRGDFWGIWQNVSANDDFPLKQLPRKCRLFQMCGL
jgi:hypothetical protein